jgi:hypothetical protein
MVQVSGEFPAPRLSAGHMSPSSVAFLFGFFICVAFLVLEFLLLDFVSIEFYGAQQEGEVLHMYKGLIQLAVTGADASCIYLESLSFSLSSLCTLVYTHGSPHTVTVAVTLYVRIDA